MSISFSWVNLILLCMLFRSFSEHVLDEGHEMKTIEETMSIIHQENDHRKINTWKDRNTKSSLLQIPAQWCHRRTKRPNVQTSSLSQLFELQWSTAQTKRQMNLWHPTIKRISDLNTNGQLSRLGDSRNLYTQQDLLKML